MIHSSHDGVSFGEVIFSVVNDNFGVEINQSYQRNQSRGKEAKPHTIVCHVRGWPSMFGVSEIERKFMGIGQVDKHVLYLVAITILRCYKIYRTKRRLNAVSNLYQILVFYMYSITIGM